MQDLLFIHWDPAPTLPGLPFRWYGLLFASAFFFGYLLMTRMFRKERVNEGWMDSLTIYMALGTVLGARFGHCFFYDPGYYLSNPLEIIMIWKGGLASHGAALGIITALILWSRRVSKRSVLWILDRIVIMVALSGLFIRSGNLMNSEIVGKPTDVSWGFVFPGEDQPEELRLKWDGDDVKVAYKPGVAIARPGYAVLRTTDEKQYHLVEGEWTRQGKSRGFYFEMTDRNVEFQNPVRYMLAIPNGMNVDTLTPVDSMDTRRAIVEHGLDERAIKIDANWQGDQIKLNFDIFGLNPRETYTAYLFRSYDGKAWDLQHRGVMGAESGSTAVEHLDTPEAGKTPRYWVTLKESESMLVVRHPAQIYEAVTYFFIFLAFLFLYYRVHDGRVPYGRFFGFFLVSVFTARFLIEFLKEGFIAEISEWPLNMGQMLSIPLVLAGVFYIVRSLKKGKEEMERDGDKYVVEGNTNDNA
ncbi:MAG: prolipoprotein diacylglyceryl transferase [Bacteroidota bacterium]